MNGMESWHLDSVCVCVCPTENQFLAFQVRTSSQSDVTLVSLYLMVILSLIMRLEQVQTTRSQMLKPVYDPVFQKRCNT